MTTPDIEALHTQVIDLEIRLALQDELLISLNDTIAQMRDALDLQQQQMRLLYQRMQQLHQNAAMPISDVSAEIPPHY